MRLLFISGTTVGGSGRSQRELAARLAARGHEVQFLVDLEDTARLRRWSYEQLSDLQVRWGDRPGARLIRWLERRPGRRWTEESIDGLSHLASPIPENAAPEVIATFRPDAVIGSSVLRLAWRKIAAQCRALGMRSVLYIREEEALNHFEGGGDPADAVVANAANLAQRIEAMGFWCPVFPSVIEVDTTKVESSREVALAINPIESRGIDTIWKVAARLPDVPFAVQESWPLSRDEVDSIEQHRVALPNVEFRRAEPPGPRLYRDARVLLVPYRIDNRPRVIAEAEANGIPVVVGDVPALIEAAGPGGVVVPLDDIDEWCRAIRSLWTDIEHYEALSKAAREHGERDEISAAGVAARFDDFLTGLVRADSLPDGPAEGRRYCGLVDLSVVIPVRNEERYLGDQLDALLAQDWAGEWDIIVVDNGSTDGTAQVVHDRARHDPRVRYLLADEKADQSYAANAGVAASEARAVVFCDADDIVGEGWLSAMASGLAEHRVVTGPNLLDRLNEPWLADSRGRSAEDPVGSFSGIFPLVRGNNYGVCSGVWDVTGPLAEDFSKHGVLADQEFSLRCWLEGIDVVGLPDAVVHYRYRADGRSLWRQGFAYGSHRPLIAKLLRESGGPRPPRFGGWRSWLLLLLRLPRVVTPRGRAAWLWIAGNRLGQVVGSFRYRTLML